MVIMLFCHFSKSEQCIALLQQSSCVLLHCLETVGNDLTVRKGHFSWGVEEGVKCACSFRRIYEEVCDVISMMPFALKV